MKTIVFPILISIILTLTSTSFAQCTSNEDCQYGYYCKKPAGQCDANGVCTEKPEICYTLWAPVCGCDGQTYSNECFAAMAGVNIQYNGQCQPPTTECTDNNDCTTGYYCKKPTGQCDANGICTEKPQVCPDIWAPVCGCDGRTYGNSCEAAAAGINIEYEGQCTPPDDCADNNDCPAGYYCKKPTGQCDANGICTEKPGGCFTLWAPVCGCDGQTYSNSCYAAAAGVNIDYEGQCISPNDCSDNNDCPKGYYCKKPEGQCDANGICTEKPPLCPDNWDPICGCDGKTYANPCYAAAAGINIYYHGQCDPSNECTDNNDCPKSHYCQKPIGQCDANGLCVEKPLGCPDVWDPVCGCDGRTYGNSCEAAAVGINVEYLGPCLPPGPTTIMTEPKALADDVHTGQSGVDYLMILWSEPVIFDANNITIMDRFGNNVTFTVQGNMTELMTINFDHTLLHDRYTIIINDSVVSVATGYPIDGDDDGRSGGSAIIIMQHRPRADFDNNYIIDFYDFAQLAQDWLMTF